jgi:hypothetical protein
MSGFGVTAEVSFEAEGSRRNLLRDRVYGNNHQRPSLPDIGSTVPEAIWGRARRHHRGRADGHHRQTTRPCWHRLRHADIILYWGRSPLLSGIGSVVPETTQGGVGGTTDTVPGAHRHPRLCKNWLARSWRRSPPLPSLRPGLLPPTLRPYWASAPPCPRSSCRRTAPPPPPRGRCRWD